jgi:hypothetical protein
VAACGVRRNPCGELPNAHALEPRDVAEQTNPQTGRWPIVPTVRPRQGSIAPAEVIALGRAAGALTGRLA